MENIIKGCDGIILDIDGTLWDSTQVCAIGYNKAISRLLGEDYPHCDGAKLKTLFGKTTAGIGAGLFPDRTEQEQYDFTMECIREEMICLHRTPPRPYEGVRQALSRIRENIDLFIVSNCESGYIELFMESCGLEDCIKDHLCPGDTGFDKKGNILEIIRRYDLKQAVYVGDVQTDAEAAHGAGIPIIYASYGFGQIKDAEYRIDRPDQLPGLFGI